MRAFAGTRVRTFGWRLSAVVLTAVALLCAGAELVDRPRGHGDAVVEARPRTTPEPSPVPKSSSSRPRPVELRIRTIGVHTTITPLGLRSDRTVEVPADPDQVGWYRPGPAPGRPGSAAILGHVDSTAGPAVFARLGTLRPGAPIEVVRSDGSVVTFTVRKVETYPNAHFPASAVYRPSGRPSLALVTCAGAYDPTRNGYQANVVVFAELTRIATGV